MNYRTIVFGFSIFGCVVSSRVSEYDMFPCSVSSAFGLGSFRCVTVSFIDSSISTVTQETVISTASGLSIQSYSDDVDHRGMPDGYIEFSDGFRSDTTFIIDMSPVGYLERLPQLGFDFGGTIVNQIDRFILSPTKLVLDFNPDDMSIFCESSTDENGGQLGWVNLANGFNDWIVRAQVTVENAENIPEQSFFMIHSGSLVSILPDEEYELLINGIRGVGGPAHDRGFPRPMDLEFLENREENYSRSIRSTKRHLCW